MPRKRSASPWFRNPLGIRQAPPRRPLPRAARQLKDDPNAKNPLKAAFWKRLGARLRPYFTWKRILIGTGIAIVLVLVAAVGTFAYYVRDLPNPTQLQERPVQATQILDRNGKNLYSIYGEYNRTLITADQISEYAKQATVAVEDANFYKHHGIDIKGLLRVARNEIFGVGVQGSGGSTLTQQYIKNVLLTRDKTATRKLKEIILAIEAERMYSKEEILVGYLNEIPYGNNAYGIESAARTYFDKSAKDLTLAEAATLAAIPQRPTYYSPYGNHLDVLFGRKDYILDRMAAQGYVTQAEADEAKKAAPSVEQPNFRTQKDLVAPHFVFYVREQLANILSNDPQTAEQRLDEAGWIVTTTLDLDLQAKAQSAVSELGPEAVKKYRATNASLAAVDPKTGELLAMVGSIDYENSQGGKNNYATALKQPGSSFKPFIYATAFGPSHTYNPGTTLYDLKTDFGGGYVPNDYDGQFRGPISIRDSLARSLNIPAVKAFALAGQKDSIETAKNLGISTLNRPMSDYGLSLVLGSGEVRAVDMAAAYAGFANGGQTYPLHSILTIKKDGETVKDFTVQESKKVVEPEVAWQISSVLSDNAARTPTFGARSNLLLPDRPAAVKTGTTQNNRDGWQVGYTPSLAVAVWVGNDEDGKTMTKGGEAAAGPIWKRFMTDALSGKPAEEFKRPDSMKQVTFDKLSGKLPTDQSPADQRVTEWLAPWQVPTENDDVHVKVRINKATNTLATELTPADLVEDRYYFRVHSEMPDNPNWENPVQEWAKNNGGGDPPTESDTTYTEGNRPTVSFTSPVNGGAASLPLTMAVTAGGSQAITSVDFTVNGQPAGTVTSAPWQLTFGGPLASGGNIIEATATNALGLKRTEQITVTYSGVSTGVPGSISNVVILQDGSVPIGAPTQPTRLSWTNPGGDIAQVNIYRSTNGNAGDLGTLVKTVLANPASNQVAEVEVNAAMLGQQFWFTLRPVSAAGAEGPMSAKAGPARIR